MLERVVEGRRHVVAKRRNARRRLGHLGREQPARRVVRVRDAAREQLVQHDPGRVDVAALVGAPLGLLGRHVVRRAGRDRRAARAGDRLGHAEVGQDQLLVALAAVVGGNGLEHDVGRLQVAVDDPERVRDLETLGDPEADPDRLLDRVAAAVLDPATHPLEQRAAVGEIHDEVRSAVRELVDVVDADDVVRVGPPEDAGLLEEPLPDLLVVRPVLGQNLDRDRRRQRLVLGEPDRRKRARADNALGSVPPEILPRRPRSSLDRRRLCTERHQRTR